MKRVVINVAPAVMMMLAGTASAEQIVTYSADLGAPAAITSPVQQGWTPYHGGTGVSVEGVTDGGTRAWKLLDNSSSLNPRYYQSLDSADYQAMYDHGWEFSVTAKIVAGQGFALWTVAQANAPEGWNIGSKGEMNGIQMFRVSGDQFEVRLFQNQTATTVNLGAGSADSFHTVKLVGQAESNAFDFYVDGTKYFSSSLLNGADILSTYDDQVLFNSGNTSLTNLHSLWNTVALQVVPEPGTLAILATGLIAILGYAWRKRR